MEVVLFWMFAVIFMTSWHIDWQLLKHHTQNLFLKWQTSYCLQAKKCPDDWLVMLYHIAYKQKCPDDWLVMMLYFFSKPPGQWLVMMLCCLVSHLNRFFLIFPVHFNVYIPILPVAVCAEAFPFPACERSSQLSHGTVSLQPWYDTAAVPLTVFLLAYLMIPSLSSGKCEFLSLRKSWLGLTKLPCGWLRSDLPILSWNS